MLLLRGAAQLSTADSTPPTQPHRLNTADSTPPSQRRNNSELTTQDSDNSALEKQLFNNRIKVIKD